MKKSKLYIISWVILLFPFVFYLCLLPFMPDKVPVHVNTSGVIDRWANKLSLEPLLICSLALIMAVIPNTIVSACLDKFSRVKEKKKSMILLLMSILFVIITLCIMIYMYIFLNVVAV